MPHFLAWTLCALGVIHIAYGVVKFKEPLAGAITAGLTGQFKSPEIRRTAFWFLMCGPLLMLSGHAAIRAVETADFDLLKIIGTYLLVTSLIGVTAFPKSPWWAPLLLSPLLIAAGYG